MTSILIDWRSGERWALKKTYLEKYALIEAEW